MPHVYVFMSNPRRCMATVMANQVSFGHLNSGVKIQELILPNLEYRNWQAAAD